MAHPLLQPQLNLILYEFWYINVYNPTLIDENRLGMASENTNFQQEFVAFLPLRFTQRQAASGPWIPGFTSSLQALCLSVSDSSISLDLWFALISKSKQITSYYCHTMMIIAGFLAS